MRIEQMNSQKTLLVLWVIYGFVFIQAVDSVLVFLSHLAYFAMVGFGVSYSILNFVLAPIIIILYFGTIFLLLKKVRTESPTTGIFLTEFPKKHFVVLLVVAVVLGPITNRLSGLFGEYTADFQNINPTEFIEFYGWFDFEIGFARWTSLIILASVYLKKYRLTK
jgi:hypothetical protein